ncbi:MAG TPA: bifunctional phosphoglucose/phosphomannose isomerase [Fimbriimonadaceae bacterium]|jgi:glucose/mannose-6-phosphate isomerase
METNADRLDDNDLLLKLDRRHVVGFIERFPVACGSAFRDADRVEIGPFGNVTNIVLAGMGGSAVAGDYLQALFESEGKSPFVTVRDYAVPTWVNQDTLVICSSYSGDTEEAISAYHSAKNRDAQILCISSGGTLSALSAQNGDQLFKVSTNKPPRFAFPRMFVGTYRLLWKLKLLFGEDNTYFLDVLRGCRTAWRIDLWSGNNPAKQLALQLHGKTPIIYGLGNWQTAVAGRWKTQINENAKLPAFANAFPELSHNEILGWKKANPKDWAIVTLEGGDENEKMKARRQFLQEQFPKITIIPVTAPGVTILEKMLALTLLGDYVSFYLAILNGTDPGDITMLTELKNRLAHVTSSG